MPYKNKQDQAAASRRHYEKNIKACRDSATQQKVRKRTWVQELKQAAPCADCKQQYPYYVMQFDHVLGDKVAAVATMINQKRGRKAIEEEIAKCEIVCANCHAIRTYNRVLEGTANGGTQS